MRVSTSAAEGSGGLHRGARGVPGCGCAQRVNAGATAATQWLAGMHRPCREAAGLQLAAWKRTLVHATSDRKGGCWLRCWRGAAALPAAQRGCKLPQEALHRVVEVPGLAVAQQPQRASADALEQLAGREVLRGRDRCAAGASPTGQHSNTCCTAAGTPSCACAGAQRRYYNSNGCPTPTPITHPAP